MRELAVAPGDESFLHAPGGHETVGPELDEAVRVGRTAYTFQLGEIPHSCPWLLIAKEVTLHRLHRPVQRGSQPLALHYAALK
jgi:hypothetical protein